MYHFRFMFVINRKLCFISIFQYALLLLFVSKLNYFSNFTSFSDTLLIQYRMLIIFQIIFPMVAYDHIMHDHQNLKQWQAWLVPKMGDHLRIRIYCKLGCLNGLIDNSLEFEIGKTTSNFTRVVIIHFHTNKLRKGMRPHHPLVTG